MMSAGFVFAFVLVAIIAIIALILASILFAETNGNGAYIFASKVEPETTVAATSLALKYMSVQSKNGITPDGQRFIVDRSGKYTVSYNFAINVTGTGGGSTTLGPVTTWVQRNAGQIMHGLTMAAPASLTPGTTNGQYVAATTTLWLDKGDSIQAWALSSNAQQILGGATSWFSMVQIQ